MIKRKLLGMKKLNATARMVQTARENPMETVEKMSCGSTYTTRSVKYLRYLRAAVEGRILKVAVFIHNELEKGNKEPAYEVYCDRKNDKWLTYEPAGDKWRTAKIDNLFYVPWYRYEYDGNWQTDSDRKLVNEYFGTGANKDIYSAVLDFQANVKVEKIKRRNRSEIEGIDEVMREVPAIPKNFENWVERNCFTEYLFYRRARDPIMYCTHCRKYMDILPDQKKIEHNKITKCPKCGTEVTFKAWNKQQVLKEAVDVALLQRLKDDSGWIMRYFSCGMKRKKDNWENREYAVYEFKRERLDDFFNSCEKFEYAEYRNTGIQRWCHESGEYWWASFIGRTQVYTPNLKRELKHERFSKMDLKKIMKGGEREDIYAIDTLKSLKRYPFIEYLQISGLDVLTDEVLGRNPTRYFNWELLDTNKKRIHEVLRLDKQTFNRYKTLKGGSRTLEALQYESRTGSRLTDEGIRFVELAGVNVRDAIEATKRTGLTLQRQLNYLEKQMRITGQRWYDLYRHYIDYLNMAETFGMDITDEIVCRQPDMMGYHDRYTERKNANEIKYRDDEVNHKYTEIKKNWKMFKEHFAFKTEEYEIVVPRKASDITEEGRRQHHCVGASDTYIKRMNDCEKFILFLRKAGDLKEPYYTLEVSWRGHIYQYYAAYDRQPDKEKISAVLREFTKQVNKRCKLANEQAGELAGNNAGLEILEVGA
jgi:hypothetical protein